MSLQRDSKHAETCDLRHIAIILDYMARVSKFINFDARFYINDLNPSLSYHVIKTSKIFCYKTITN